MLKGQVLKIVGDVAQEQKVKLSRLEKFNTFCYVCDQLLKEARITEAQHYSWTNLF